MAGGGCAGFEQWFTSQSQLPTATPNCGCFPPTNWAGPLTPAEYPASWNDSEIYREAPCRYTHCPAQPPDQVVMLMAYSCPAWNC